MNTEELKINEITNKFFSKSTFLHKLFPRLTVFHIRKKSARRLDKLFFDICKKFSVKNFIDCGANVGGDSLQAINAGFNNVLAIEPNPYPFVNMTFKPSEQFKKINVGLSDKEEVLKFYSLKNVEIGPRLETATNASFVVPKNNLNKYDIIEVPVIPLDKLLKNSIEINSSFALWIDVEGMQEEVLTGAQETLKHKNCKLIKIEVENEPIFNKRLSVSKDIENFLTNLGYEAIYRDFEYVSCYNILFVKKDDAFHLEMEINNSFDDIAESINISNISSHLIYFFLLRKLKALVIKIFGLKLGNIIAALYGSKDSKKFLK